MDGWSSRGLVTRSCCKLRQVRSDCLKAMIVTLEPDVRAEDLQRVLDLIKSHGLTYDVKEYKGTFHTVHEVLLFGDTKSIGPEVFDGLPGVLRAVRVSAKYRLIGRHDDRDFIRGFEYNGVTISEEKVTLFPGLCAVDNPENVEAVFKALQACGIRQARMGAYKPRTSPYDFQGLGKTCLNYVFELAGKYDVRIIAMEVTCPSQIDEIRQALKETGYPTGVMLQIGTRNTQNFELLKAVGKAHEFPVLFKRGMGITLEESLNAAEYVAANGNTRIIFCLRGVKTHLGAPHRNLVDFAHVPVIKRLTKCLVCVDPSHSVGTMRVAPDGISDIFHAVGQGLISGADMVLIDFHPFPEQALCDGPQALKIQQLPHFVRYVETVRRAYINAKAIFAEAGEKEREIPTFLCQ